MSASDPAPAFELAAACFLSGAGVLLSSFVAEAGWLRSTVPGKPGLQSVSVLCLQDVG